MKHVDRCWVLDKRINLGNLFTAFMIASSVFWWAAQLDKRVTVLEIEFGTYSQEHMELKAIQRDIDSKLDKLK